MTLGLLHGAQPDAFVVCHEPTRTTMRGVQHPLPSIGEVIDLTIRLGRLTNPDIRPVGIAINTAALGEAAGAAHAWRPRPSEPTACRPSTRSAPASRRSSTAIAEIFGRP